VAAAHDRILMADNHFRTLVLGRLRLRSGGQVSSPTHHYNLPQVTYAAGTVNRDYKQEVYRLKLPFHFDNVEEMTIK
jgi:hypothetical protein